MDTEEPPRPLASGTSLIGEPGIERETLLYQIRQKKEERKIHDLNLRHTHAHTHMCSLHMNLGTMQAQERENKRLSLNLMPSSPT